MVEAVEGGLTSLLQTYQVSSLQHMPPVFIAEGCQLRPLSDFAMSSSHDLVCQHMSVLRFLCGDLLEKLEIGRFVCLGLSVSNGGGVHPMSVPGRHE